MKFHEAAEIFPLDESSIAGLADDIAKHGQCDPVEVFEGQIIDGRRRLMACEKLSIKPKLKTISVSDPVSYSLSKNLHRRHLSPTQLSMVGARARAIYDRQAKERMSEGQKSGGRGHTKNSPANLPDSYKGDARDQAGKAVGVSGKSIDAATKVLNTATPELIAAVEADHVAVSTAARAASLSEEEQNALARRAAADSANGRKRPRKKDDGDAEPVEEERELKGKGIILAHEAINCLTRIPKNDALRKRGFQLVTDWIRRNK